MTRLQTAVFVDAGYLYAQGSALVAGHRARREAIHLDVPATLSALREEAARVEPDARLLRIYWYDGMPRGGTPSLEQRALATSDSVKCRYGTINSRGEQKGVDSLIVTDLIELARAQAISDALIVSADEDIRVGVQAAQAFGIRVHLLGIASDIGTLGYDLRAEADTCAEWDADTVSAFLEVATLDSSPVAEPDAAYDWISLVVARTVTTMAVEEARAIRDHAQTNGQQLPYWFDRPALAQAGNAVARELTQAERHQFRASLLDAVRRRADEET